MILQSETKNFDPRPIAEGHLNLTASAPCLCIRCGAGRGRKRRHSFSLFVPQNWETFHFKRYFFKGAFRTEALLTFKPKRHIFRFRIVLLSRQGGYFSTNAHTGLNPFGPAFFCTQAWLSRPKRRAGRLQHSSSMSLHHLRSCVYFCRGVLHPLTTPAYFNEISGSWAWVPQQILKPHSAGETQLSARPSDCHQTVDSLASKISALQ